MALGKNKLRVKKGNKKKTVDPFTKKDWYKIKAPAVFKARQVGYSLCNRTSGMRIAADSLKGRIFETCLADLQGGDEDHAHRKIKLRCEDVQGDELLTTFYGMDLTTDKLRSLVRKWQTLVEARVDVKTADGFTLRIFAIGFTKRRPNQVKQTTYAQTAQIRKLRAKMVSILERETAGADLKDLVNKFIPESIGKQIEKECESIFPLKDCYVRKVKTLKYPKFDAVRLAEAHKDVSTGDDNTTADGEDLGAALVQGAGATTVAADLAADAQLSHEKPVGSA
eukprot:TRINITY_DN7460_c0_g1_i1.p2 TRINITY_DN7460_c0_g1~~TRINITY_DN7460_c0_g1_i1.p2  ORF type:complete len:281 (-),score=167.95 TRINITY_DN7460_c0_g1_i1:135-977(-)